MKASPPRIPSLPIPVLRAAVTRAVAEHSLRKIAREIGLSPNGLRNFLNGAIPRASTRLKLERWLAAQGRPPSPPTLGHLVRLIGEISTDLSPRQVAELGRAVASFLHTAYESRNVPAPGWVHELAAYYGGRTSKTDRSPRKR